MCLLLSGLWRDPCRPRQSRPGCSHLSASPSSPSIHKLLLVKKSLPSVYMQGLMVILLSACATPYIRHVTSIPPTVWHAETSSWHPALKDSLSWVKNSLRRQHSGIENVQVTRCLTSLWWEAHKTFSGGVDVKRVGFLSCWRSSFAPTMLLHASLEWFGLPRNRHFSDSRKKAERANSPSSSVTDTYNMFWFRAKLYV